MNIEKFHDAIRNAEQTIWEFRARNPSWVLSRDTHTTMNAHFSRDPAFQWPQGWSDCDTLYGVRFVINDDVPQGIVLLCVEGSVVGRVDINE